MPSVQAVRSCEQALECMLMSGKHLVGEMSCRGNVQ